MILPIGRTRLFLAAALAITALSVGNRVEAQEARSNTQGLVLGAGVSGTSLEVESGDPQNGSGGYLLLGYAPSRLITIFLRGDASRVDIDYSDISGSYTMAFVDLGLRFSFGGPQKSFVPWVMGAFTAQAAGATIPVTATLSSDVTISGTGLTLGAGFDVFLTRTLALDLGLMATSGRFTDVSVGSISTSIDALDTRSGRLTLGLSWFPMVPHN